MAETEPTRAARLAFNEAHAALMRCIANRFAGNPHNLLHAANRAERLDDLDAKVAALRAAANAFGPPARAAAITD